MLLPNQPIPNGLETTEKPQPPLTLSSPTRFRDMFRWKYVRLLKKAASPKVTLSARGLTLAPQPPPLTPSVLGAGRCDPDVVPACWHCRYQRQRSPCPAPTFGTQHGHGRTRVASAVASA